MIVAENILEFVVLQVYSYKTQEVSKELLEKNAREQCVSLIARVIEFTDAIFLVTRGSPCIFSQW